MKQTTKVLLASLIGSTIEWYDFFLYGTVAPLVFSKIFFPNLSPLVALLVSYASFGIPFFFRPLGGIVFSHIGDRIGRKKTLIITLSIMGISTVVMGLLPTYQSIGTLAPILLVLLRLLQGIGLGGEWGGSMLLAVEYSSPGKKGFFGSVPMAGVYIGMLMGTVSLSLLSTLPQTQFIAWGWRIPFILSALLVAVGLWIRSGIDETPEFEKTKKTGDLSKFPLGETLRLHWREVLITLGVKFIEATPFYLFATFSISYATKYLGYNQTTVLNAVSVATLVITLAIPVMGFLSDKIGRKRFYIIGAVCVMLYAFPYFYLMSLKTTTALYAATILGLLASSPLTATIGTLFSEIFTTRVRYTGISIGYQLGAAIAGGTAPFIATALLAAFHSWVPVALYLVGMGVISLISLSFARIVGDNEEIQG
ncbi:metabolite-proton symporter [Paenibacillus sophorae]|uniref:Putative proline/betaine transporter n=1 Tax=Paenibacillus sophorae TaxID=1333845 RepID=A0A1H8RSS0_9BACL|nr:MFS transporter [Paenibacillus sophorae]QWU16996.1 MHS family MFS transporter [Paenibacillus sophorae]SEO69420.1 metabolite-proton symporter [Paenibacillus sophorae]